jgi:hexosaminidase
MSTKLCRKTLKSTESHSERSEESALNGKILRFAQDDRQSFPTKPSVHSARLTRLAADGTSASGAMHRKCHPLRHFCCLLSLGVMQLLGMAAPLPAEHPALVPLPVKVEWTDGTCTLPADTKIVYAGEAAKAEAEMLASMLRPATGFSLPVQPIMPRVAGKVDNTILLSLATDLEPALGKEGYRLDAWPIGVVQISAATPAGLFYGGQTLRQLLPQAIVHDSKQSDVKWEFPCCKIEDRPRLAWRGMLFDVCRHFFDKEQVKRYIDLLALHKINVLHWHLTEDQGWRIEIKKYPKLTEIGGWRDETMGDGKRYGGFYTQDDIREVVAYAATRHITVVPEIEMPGHAMAALTAYPGLSCTGGPFKVRTQWGIEKDVYCAGNDETFALLEGVLDEVLALFPSTFIHIGGDECPKDRWKACPKCQARIKAEGLKDEHELQSYVIRRIEKYLDSKGRRLIGWDEILEGGLPPKATVMSWRGMKGAIEAATSGHDYVATPTSHCYLDYKPKDISLEKAYSLEPVPKELTPGQAAHCIGVQGNMWTEHVPTPAILDRQVWPRLCALAEVGWTPAEQRNWSDFRARMELHAKRLATAGVQGNIVEQVEREKK